MKTTRVELPDGRLLTIQGGDAASTAKLLMNHYLGQSPVTPQTSNREEPLEAPEFPIESSDRENALEMSEPPIEERLKEHNIFPPILRNAPVTNNWMEEPLPLPSSV